MSKVPEASGIAPSDGWYGGGNGDTAPRTEISVVNHLAPGDEVASGYRNLVQQHNFDRVAGGGYNEGGPPDSHQYNGIKDLEGPNTPLPLCHCGQPCSRLMSHSARNPNRWFLKCPKYKDDATQCKYFVWEDEMGSKSPLPPPASRRRVDNTAAPYTTAPVPYRPAPPATAAAAAAAGGGTQEGDMQPLPSRDRSNDECFHCGGKGHWSSECTMPKGGPIAATGGMPSASRGFGSAIPIAAASGGGGGGINTPFSCYKCGQEGHYARDCLNQTAPPAGGGGGYPSQQPSGGGRAGTCFKCGEEGHWSRDCPHQGAVRGNTGGGVTTGGGAYGAGNGGGGGASRGGTCFKCGEEGHWSRDCPNQAGGGAGGGVKRRYEGGAGYDINSNYGGGGGGGGGGYGGTSYGGGSGYGGGGGGGGGSGGCFKCGGTGHWSRDCPNR